MTNVVCSGCGSNYAAAAVAKLAKFRCAKCGEILAGGLAAAPERPPAPAPAAREQATAPAAAAPRRAARRAPAESAPRGGVPPAAWIGGGAALVAVIGIGIAMSGKKEPPADASPAAAPAGAPAAAPEPAKADPMKDPAAWKALPETERASRAAAYAGAVDATSSASVVRAKEFLTARGETAAIASLAGRVLEHDGENAWAHAALGHADLGAEVDAALRQCELADDANETNFLALKALRARHSTGTWWADADAAKRVRDRIAALKKAEESLKTPYGQGVARWVSLQRASPIMRDNPALHATVGPYVIFVSLNVPRDAKDIARDVTLADVPKEEIARGERVLEHDRKLFSEFYDGWMESIGARLGLTRYGPENADMKTLMKVNVFSSPSDFAEYNAKIGAGIGLFTRAYYSPMEPRYVVTYDGSGGKRGPDSEPEDQDYVDHVQCHEATHQLVHFYTWDLTRRDIGREPDWLHVAWRPLWSGEGFAEFCSAFAVKDGKRVWMQPLDSRMAEMWVFGEMVREKGWKDWKLREFLGLTNGRELEAFAKVRALKNEDEIVATGVMSNLFYGQAWSFVYFLWYAEEDGRPKYRDRYLEYLKAEFHVRFVTDQKTGQVRPAPAYSGTFGQIMGFTTGAHWEAFEKEWKDYAEKLVLAHRKPAWDDLRTKLRKNFRFDQPAKKDEKAK